MGDHEGDYYNLLRVLSKRSSRRVNCATNGSSKRASKSYAMRMPAVRMGNVISKTREKERNGTSETGRTEQAC